LAYPAVLGSGRGPCLVRGAGGSTPNESRRYRRRCLAAGRCDSPQIGTRASEHARGLRRIIDVRPYGLTIPDSIDSARTCYPGLGATSVLPPDKVWVDSGGGRTAQIDAGNECRRPTFSGLARSGATTRKRPARRCSAARRPVARSIRFRKPQISILPQASRSHDLRKCQKKPNRRWVIVTRVRFIEANADVNRRQ